MHFDTIDAVLEFAIGKEEEAAQMYRDLADKVRRPGMRETLLEFVREEENHRTRLQRIRTGEQPAVSAERVQDLRIADYLVDAQASPAMTYPEALLFAMKAEKAAFRLYSDLAVSATVPQIAETFRVLAQEEAKHKLRFELEYEDQVLEGV
jgi:rubrerythrin